MPDVNILGVVLALVGSCIATLFAVQMGRQYAAKRRDHALAWCLSFVLYVLGMLALAVGFAFGWEPPVYGLYWLTGALLNVPLLAVGQLHLSAPKLSVLWWTFALLFTVWTVGAMLTSNFDHSVLAAATTDGTIPAGAEAIGRDSLAYSVLRPFTMGGTLVVVAGTLWSAISSRRYGLLLISVGVLISASSSTFLRMGLDAWVAVALTAGISVMYLGFQAAAKPSKRPKDAAPAKAAA